MLLGARLKEARINMGYTQKDLSEKLGVSKVTVCGYEKGSRVPSLGIFLKLLDVLNVEPNFLLGRDTLVCENGSNYTIKMAKEDINLLKTIKNNSAVYNKFLSNPNGVINFINRKLN